MTTMETKLWEHAVHEVKMTDALREMAAYEQAAPSVRFYHYPLDEEQAQVGLRYRLFFRTPDGRFRLTPAGKMFAHKL